MSESIFHFGAKLLGERLDFVKTKPKKVAIIGADLGSTAQLIAEKYQVNVDEFDFNPQRNINQKKSSWLGKWTQKHFNRFYPLDEELINQKQGQYDFILSNFFLVRHAGSKNDFLRWSNLLLKEQGMLFFVFLGLDSFQELFSNKASDYKQWQEEVLWDMHDIGDELLRNGFIDPVLSMENISLKYKHLNSMFKDLSDLGLLPILSSSLNMAEEQLENEFAKMQFAELSLTLELIFAHAIKKTKENVYEQEIKIYP